MIDCGVSATSWKLTPNGPTSAIFMDLKTVARILNVPNEHMLTQMRPNLIFVRLMPGVKLRDVQQ